MAAVRQGQRQARQLLRRLHRGQRAHRLLAATQVGASAGALGLHQPQLARHIGRRGAQGLQLDRVERHMHLALHATHAVDGAHAAHVLQPLFQHLIGPAGQCNRIGRRHALAIGGGLAMQGMGVWQHGQRPDCRAGRVETDDAWLLDLVTQSGTHCGNLLTLIVGSAAAVYMQLELDDDDAGAFIAA